MTLQLLIQLLLLFILIE